MVNFSKFEKGTRPGLAAGLGVGCGAGILLGVGEVSCRAAFDAMFSTTYLYLSLSITRSLALCARWLTFNSSSVGSTGFLLINLKSGWASAGITGRPGGKSGKLVASLNIVFTKRSSKDWKVITEIRPPTFKSARACSKESSSAPSSSLTAIRIA